MVKVESPTPGNLTKIDRTRQFINDIAWVKYSSAAVVIVLPLLVSFIPSLLVCTDIYKNFAKPAWAPPVWLFGPVWSVLYLMMGWASYLIWKDGRNNLARDTNMALVVYGVQLVLNWFSIPLFFTWGDLAATLAEMCVMWTLIAVCTVQFFKISTLSSVLMLPYFAWATFAVALTYRMLNLNGCQPFWQNELHNNSTA